MIVMTLHAGTIPSQMEMLRFSLRRMVQNPLTSAGMRQSKNVEFYNIPNFKQNIYRQNNQEPLVHSPL